ncbi:hypothetical protein Ddye_020996 [Dipteronia dyeriana]|uniref:Uncharacterized protein n=1 Tax=Dipteronia dyeriana TaxID=168575 RepID=A0AAD9U1L7_9ROSI|nr:hypothetical protein Ddye_020996 [Dipteronia dyeriana]
MFQVTNRGVPKQVIGCEITGYGLPRISTFFSKLFWSEGFSIMGSPLHHARQLRPNHHFNFYNVMVEYQKELMGLSERILGLMFTSLGLTQEDIKCLSESKNGSKHPHALLQQNSYPLCPDPTRPWTALHRALVNQTRHRLSIAYCYGPKDVNISPSIKLVDHDHPILYRPVTWKRVFGF